MILFLLSVWSNHFSLIFALPIKHTTYKSSHFCANNHNFWFSQSLPLGLCHKMRLWLKKPSKAIPSLLKYHWWVPRLFNVLFKKVNKLGSLVVLTCRISVLMSVCMCVYCLPIHQVWVEVSLSTDHKKKKQNHGILWLIVSMFFTRPWTCAFCHDLAGQTPGWGISLFWDFATFAVAGTYSTW